MEETYDKENNKNYENFGYGDEILNGNFYQEVLSVCNSSEEIDIPNLKDAKEKKNSLKELND